MSLSDSLRHFFHEVSTVRPTYWILVYLALIPLFAFIYWLMPDSQFRIPEGGGVQFGSWLYYSIVTITTLGFGEYTPAHGWAQTVTAIEVLAGLSIFGFFLNAVGSMKSEIDIASERERARIAHENNERRKLERSVPVIIHNLNLFLSYCYAVTTPLNRRSVSSGDIYNQNFTMADMADLYAPSSLPFDHTLRPAVDGLLQCAAHTAIFIDQLQSRIDLTIWPDLMEDCFSFVARWQLFASAESLRSLPQTVASTHKSESSAKAIDDISSRLRGWQGDVAARPGDAINPVVDLYHYIKESGRLAKQIEVTATKAAVGSKLS